VMSFRGRGKYGCPPFGRMLISAKGAMRFIWFIASYRGHRTRNDFSVGPA
jgi:hypothetical protein